MLEAEKKHLMQENAPEKKFMMDEGVEKIILATLNSPKNSPLTPSEMKSWPVNTVTVHLPVFFCFVFFCFCFFSFSDNFYCGPVSKEENYVFFLKHQVTLIFFVYEKYQDTSFCILVYNYPERRSNIYVALFTDPEGDSCFSIHQISWIKIKEAPFSKLKTSLIRNFVYNLQTFRGFCQEHFYNFAAN